MIAWAGACRMAAGHADPLSVAAKARWPISEVTLPVAKDEEKQLSKVL